MRQRIALFGLIVMMSSLSSGAMASAQGTPQSVRPDEYASVALIYNQEFSALGNKALYPICIDVAYGRRTKPLLQYLRKAGFAVSDLSVCEPATARGGQHHPKDYAHGLRIFIDKLQRNQEGYISMHVVTEDLTVRPGEDLATTLRRGTYHLKQNEAQEWRITGYAKEYDFRDKKPESADCNAS